MASTGPDEGMRPLFGLGVVFVGQGPPYASSVISTSYVR